MKVINSVSRVIGYVATAIILMLMLLTVADVFLRYVFNSPIMGTTELTEMMMISMLLAVAWCAVEGKHVSIDLVMSHASPRFRAVVDSLTLLAALVVYIMLVGQGIVGAIFAFDFDYKSSLLGIPEYPFRVLLALSFAMLCVVMVTIIIQRIGKAVKG